MYDVKILGVSGSPRLDGNTCLLVKKALEGAQSTGDVKIELYQFADKKVNHCTACFKCLETGKCVFKDDFEDFAQKYFEADGIILGAPVYHMGIPSIMKAALDRLGNSTLSKYYSMGKQLPLSNKVCGFLSIGIARYGGQEQVLTSLINSTLLMNGIPVAGNTKDGDYIGVAANLRTNIPASLNTTERVRSKDLILNDKEGVDAVMRLGKRVSGMAKIIKAGISALRSELPDEYLL